MSQLRQRMSRRLLQRLEQGIECPGGEHVHLVDNVDPVLAAGGAHNLIRKYGYATGTVVMGKHQGFRREIG